MVFLGILLAIIAAAVGVGVVLENSSSASLSVFGQHVPGVQTQGQVFAAGVLVAFVFLLGLAVAVLTMGRAMRVRRELRDLREEHQESVTTLELERQRLERELARARRGAPGAAPTAAQAATATDVPVAGRRTHDGDPMSPFFDRSSS